MGTNHSRSALNLPYPELVRGLNKRGCERNAPPFGRAVNLTSASVASHQPIESNALELQFERLEMSAAGRGGEL
jgi:hypothetical protein